MNKKYFAVALAFFACVSIMSMAVYAVTDESSNTNSITLEVEDVNYYIAYEKSNSLMRNADSEISLSFDISTDQDKPFTIASYPIAAADESFNTPLDTYDCSVENGKVSVKATVAPSQNVIYVRTPFVAKKTETALEVEDVDALQVETHFDAQLGTYITVISFNATDLEVAPNRATLNYNGDSTKSMFTNLYYDEVGNYVGGELWFHNPDNDTLTDNFTLTILEAHTIIPSQTVAINIE